MTMHENCWLDVTQAVFGTRNLVRAALMATFSCVLVLAEVGCSSSSTAGNPGSAGQGGSAAGGSSANSGGATTASGGHAGISSTGQTGIGGSLASGGSTASAGAVGTSGGSSSASIPTGGGISAGGTRATGGTTVSGGTTGGLGGSGGTTTIGGGTSGGKGGSGSGGSAAGGSAVAGSTGTVSAGGRDAGSDAPLLPDSGSSGDAAAEGGSEVKADADAGGEGDSDVTPVCKGILFDNNGPPAIYPVIYREPADALDTFEAEKARLLSTYGLAESSYSITATPITRVAQIQGGTSTWLQLAGGRVDANNAVPVTEAFLSDWGKLFGYEGILAAPQAPFAPYCFSNFCRVDFTQDYCGLSLFSREFAYNGTATVLIQSQVGGVYSVVAGFVPMQPLPRNILVTEEQVKSAIVGQKFTYSCATGLRTVEVSDQDAFTIPNTQIVHIRTSPTIAAALEYRLSIPVFVMTGGMPWTVYVDGIDGSFIEGVASFICD